jgi:hypothetical protein
MTLLHAILYDISLSKIRRICSSTSILNMPGLSLFLFSTGSVKEVLEKVKEERRWHNREDKERRILHDMLDKELPGWYNRYLGLLGIGPNKPLSKEARKKIEDMREQMRNLPDDDNIDG